MNDLLWSPSIEKIKNSNLFKFKDLIEKKYKVKLETDYQKLWNWSVKNDENFWSECWDFFKLQGFKGKQVIKKNKIFHKTKFFPDAKINFAKNLIIKKEYMIYAIWFRSETGYEKKITWKELYEKTMYIFSVFKKKWNKKK